MRDKHDHHDDKGTSLAKGPAGIAGLVLLAYGITGLIFGGNDFGGTNPIDGLVDGEEWLGIEGNGWSNLLWVATGALVLFGSPMHWGAKTASLIAGLVLGAASVISLIDGENVFGIFAANGPTMLAWGVAAAVLLALALLPRAGKDKHRGEQGDRHDERIVERERPAERGDRFDRGADPARTPTGGSVSYRDRG